MARPWRRKNFNDLMPAILLGRSCKPHCGSLPAALTVAAGISADNLTVTTLQQFFRFAVLMFGRSYHT